ncbi:MAG: hypothetical protein RL375_3687 [Pseudomonadota bacterium]
MDDLVIAALHKWPNVPAAYGWLALDARGDWYLRDEAVQAHAPFPELKGSRIEHRRLIEFIGRNYLADGHGAWFFQNGPQRVYVELEAAPLVAGVERLSDDFVLTSHVGLALGCPGACLLDESGRLFVATSDGLAIVRSTDMLAAADALDAGAWPAPQAVVFGDLARRFGHQLQPTPPRSGPTTPVAPRPA